MAYIDLFKVSSPHQSEVAKISFFIASLSHEFHVMKMPSLFGIFNSFFLNLIPTSCRSEPSNYLSILTF